jgi:hypothetical protein
MIEIGARRRLLGESLWLYCLLMLSATTQEATDPWWPVCGGAPISDERIAVFLDVGAATARKWRRRLEKDGLIRSEPSTPLHRRIWVANVNPVETQKALQEQLPLSNLVH